MLALKAILEGKLWWCINQSPFIPLFSNIIAALFHGTRPCTQFLQYKNRNKWIYLPIGANFICYCFCFMWIRCFPLVHFSFRVISCYNFLYKIRTLSLWSEFFSNFNSRLRQMSACQNFYLSGEEWAQISVFLVIYFYRLLKFVNTNSWKPFLVDWFSQFFENNLPELLNEPFSTFRYFDIFISSTDGVKWHFIHSVPKKK